LSALALTAGLWCAAGVPAKADGVEYLMVPSAAMGRDIPVAFMAGGPHAVYLLDAFNAAPEVSNWVTAGNAMTTLAGKGISVAAPAGGAWSMYTNWEQDGSRQWDTFLSQELPDWLAANKGLAPGGHGVVGAAQGGYGALALATFHPDRFRYAGSMSGVLAPERTGVDGAVTDGMARFGGVDIRNMWGLPQLGRWKWHSPYAHVALLASNNTRIWVYCGTGRPSDLDAGLGNAQIPAQLLEGMTLTSNTNFQQRYLGAGGRNGVFNFPPNGTHSWGYWGGQLQAMKPDIQRVLGAAPAA